MKEVNDADSLPYPLLLLSLADGAIAGVAAGCRSHRSSVCRVGIGSGKSTLLVMLKTSMRKMRYDFSMSGKLSCSEASKLGMIGIRTLEMQSGRFLRSYCGIAE